MQNAYPERALCTPSDFGLFYAERKFFLGRLNDYALTEREVNSWISPTKWSLNGKDFFGLSMNSMNCVNVLWRKDKIFMMNAQIYHSTKWEKIWENFLFILRTQLMLMRFCISATKIETKNKTASQERHRRFDSYTTSICNSVRKRTMDVAGVRAHWIIPSDRNRLLRKLQAKSEDFLQFAVKVEPCVYRRKGEMPY